jgi:hypothetical protein
MSILLTGKVAVLPFHLVLSQARIGIPPAHKNKMLYVATSL